MQEWSHFRDAIQTPMGMDHFEFGFVVFYTSDCLCADIETKIAGRRMV